METCHRTILAYLLVSVQLFLLLPTSSFRGDKRDASDSMIRRLEHTNPHRLSTLDGDRTSCIDPSGTIPRIWSLDSMWEITPIFFLQTVHMLWRGKHSDCQFWFQSCQLQMRWLSFALIWSLWNLLSDPISWHHPIRSCGFFWRKIR